MSAHSMVATLARIPRTATHTRTQILKEKEKVAVWLRQNIREISEFRGITLQTKSYSLAKQNPLPPKKKYISWAGGRGRFKTVHQIV